MSLAFSLALIQGSLLYYSALTAPQAFRKPQEIVIPQKASLGSIAQALHETKLIDSPFLFKVSARLMGLSGSLKAGEYLFEPPLSLAQIIRKLSQGEVLIHKVTLVEGKTSRDLLALLEGLPKLQGALQEAPLEGSCLSETYAYTFGETRENLVMRMQKALSAFKEETERKGLLPPTPLKSFEEVVILASLVEKETALPQERPRIAAVFLNRLKAGMRLQCDPTVHYALFLGTGRPLNQGLSKTDLQYPSPYNTYLIRGLPPTSICNVGRDSILAVLTPARTNDLFFVANGSGGHIFTESSREHQKNHHHWRKIRKEKKAL